MERAPDTVDFLGPLLQALAESLDVREIFSAVPQQSDYVNDWVGTGPVTRPKRFEAWKESPILRPIRRVRRHMLLRRHRRMFSFSNRAFYQPADLRI